MPADGCRPEAQHLAPPNESLLVAFRAEHQPGSPKLAGILPESGKILDNFGGSRVEAGWQADPSGESAIHHCKGNTDVRSRDLDPSRAPRHPSASLTLRRLRRPAGSVAGVEVITSLDPAPWPGERTIVTIGAYDGVHLGHQAVIDQVRAIADEMSARSVVLTFDRHPASIVRPESAPPLLTNNEQRLELLAKTGLGATVVLSFDEHQAHETPESFIERVLVEALGVRTIVVGQDFHFGRDRRGNVDLLEKVGRTNDFDVRPVGLVPRVDGVDEPISSTAIRRALAGGDVTRAAIMLGRMHEVRGTVVMGDQRGRLLGFPTANVAVPKATCVPADGVYAGWYERPTGEVHPCAINIGRRPTFYEHADSSLLEAHLLDFTDDLYGELAEVRFAHFLRSERKFDGIEAIVAQLTLDVQHARDLLAADAR